MRIPPNKRMTPELERYIIQEYKNGNSASEILDKIEIFKTTKTIYDVLKKYDISTRDSDRSRDPNLKTDYFEVIDSQEKAYALGLMISDGWVSKGDRNKSPQIAFSLLEEDKYLVSWMKEQWNSKNKINIIHKDDLKPPMYRIMVSSQKMYRDLDALGIDVMKSYVSILPIIDESLYSHLIRGIFDGDGCVHLNKTSKKLNIRLYGTQCLIGQINLWLSQNIGITYQKPSGRKNTSFAYAHWSSDEDIQIFYDFIYANANTFMNRKRKTFEDCLG